MAVVVEVGEDLAAEEVEVGVEDGDVGFRLLLVCLAIDMKSGMNFRVSETRYQNVSGRKGHYNKCLSDYSFKVNCNN